MAAKTVRLRATQTGYYDLRIIKEDDEFDFVLTEGGELPFWAVPVSKKDADIPQEDVPRTQTQADKLPEGVSAII